MTRRLWWLQKQDREWLGTKLTRQSRAKLRVAIQLMCLDCPSTIITVASFRSQRCPGLDDK
jgi:hypothetical protein